MTEDQIQVAKEAMRLAIEKFETQEGLANHLKTSQQNVSRWLITGIIGAKFVSAIWSVLGGKYTKHQLRPDIFSQDEEKAA